MTQILESKLRAYGLNAAAREIGVSKTAVGYWASGERKPKPVHAMRVAALLGLTPAEVRPDLAELMEGAAE